MSSTKSDGAAPGRPVMSHNSKSFSRIEPTRSSPLRSRANTLSHGVVAEVENPLSYTTDGAHDSLLQEDVFEKSPNRSNSIDTVHPLSPQELPEGFDDLPIELISLIDRFLESLTVKAHRTPPTIEKISDRFQEFYAEAETHIATHISILSTRQNRQSSPTSSMSSKKATSIKESNRLRTSSSGDSLARLDAAIPEQQMLTPQEISERRRARRLLEHKRVALEEAVEKRVCERIYQRIWRHRSTLDEVRDEKLRSRTAALALVGIGLADLGVTFDKSPSNEKSQGPDIGEWISKAREGLLKMNDARHPLGKLQHLAATHKCIVDLLTSLHQSSSSADEILPTLIYTLITTPPEGINVISNLHFAQRFRNANKIDGEAAYCLTNLEAAITFLETVDLATLRSDEPLEGPPKSSSRPSTPQSEHYTEWATGTPMSGSISNPAISPEHAQPASISLGQPPQSPPQSPPNTRPTDSEPPPHKRRVSDLFQPSSTALGAAGDAVRTTADQGFRNISSTLDNSFKFLFGRLKERQESIDATATNGEVILPRTLADARRLVEPKRIDEDEAPASGASSVAEHQLDGPTEGCPKPLTSTSEEKLLGIIAGRKEGRDRSVDSTQSSGSGKRVAFATTTGPGKPAGTSVSSKVQQMAEPAATSSPIESMRNLGNSLNPLKGFSAMGGLRAFGRSTSSSTNPPTLATVTSNGNEKAPSVPPELANAKDESAVGDPLVSKPRIEPPAQKFLELADARELRIGDAAELLEDYKRLAEHLRNMGAFSS